MKLQFETAVVVFRKKDKTLRAMLCSRNLRTGMLCGLDGALVQAMLGSHDKRCSIANGNMCVMDLVLGEPRSFGVDRVHSIEFKGVVETQERFDEVMGEFLEVSNKVREISTLSEYSEQERELELLNKKDRACEFVDTQVRENGKLGGTGVKMIDDMIKFGKQMEVYEKEMIKSFK